MLQITELLTPTPQPLWRLVRQAGVEEVVTLLDGAEQMWRWPHGAGFQDWTPGSLSAARPGRAAVGTARRSAACRRGTASTG